jgi:N,N-dimethylformamidase beta subunit-like, C-terminal/FlgD Ig-like domain
VTLVARVVFAVLVAATFGAFFVAQRLKHSPPVVQQFNLFPFFSPNRDGRFERATVTLKLKKSDDVTVAVVDAKGDEVRELAGDESIPADTLMRFKWDGRTDGGALAPDGFYRIRLSLTHQGRSVIVPRKTRLDTIPPRPLVVSVGPESGPGPELLPRADGKPAEIHLSAPGRRLKVSIYKMGPGRPRKVIDALPGVRDGATTATWDGTVDGRGGRPVSAGTYLAGVEVRDEAGNIGRSPQLGRNGLPPSGYAQRLPGHGGITVRYLGVEPPLVATPTGAVALFGVDARQQRYSWSVRRVGSPAVVRRGTKSKSLLRLHAPGKESGVYLFQAHTARHVTTVPFAVQGAGTQRVLVVLPVMTWQGRNPVDDDGDGLPDLLDRGVGAKLHRVFAGDGLPAGFATREAPLLAWLARTGRRFDVTTDVALARNVGPRPEDHRGVLIPGDARWLPAAVQQRLRRFVRNGGTLASFGVDSLRRQVSVSARERLVEPTPPADVDLFGSRLRALRRTPAPVTLTADADAIQLFTGTTGSFAGYTELEATASPGAAKVEADAITPGLQPVIVALRVGKGRVLRYGLPELPSKISSDPQVTALLKRSWTLLSR